MELKPKPIKLKSLEEILARFKELVHRHRRRFLSKNLSTCPYNCKKADVVGREVIGCNSCGSRNPDFCKNPKLFIPLYSKEQLSEQFKRALRDPQVLLREYRDLVVFLWCLNQFSEEEVPEHILEKVEK